MTKDKGNSLRIAIFCSEGEYLKIAHGSGYSPDGIKKLRLSLSSSSAGYCYTSKEKYFTDDVTSDPRYKRHPKSSREYFSLMCVPIQYEEEVIGILNVDGLKRKSFDRDDLDHLSYFASALAPLLKKEFEYKENHQKEAL
jgi:putative methionine-R-sulfoxide reductase with GAF domain